MFHKDCIVQFTRDAELRLGCSFRGEPPAGAVEIALRRACMVEFMFNRQTVTLRVDDRDLAEVRPNARD